MARRHLIAAIVSVIAAFILGAEAKQKAASYSGSQPIADELTQIGREMAALHRRAQELAVGRTVRVVRKFHPRLDYLVVEAIVVDLKTGLVRVVFPFYGPDDQRLDRVEWLDDEMTVEGE